jgi:hypothetical protein
MPRDLAARRRIDQALAGAIIAALPGDWRSGELVVEIHQREKGFGASIRIHDGKSETIAPPPQVLAAANDLIGQVRRDNEMFKRARYTVTNAGSG